jgi:hypothetical protein
MKHLVLMMIRFAIVLLGCACLSSFQTCACTDLGGSWASNTDCLSGIDPDPYRAVTDNTSCSGGASCTISGSVTVTLDTTNPCDACSKLVIVDQCNTSNNWTDQSSASPKTYNPTPVTVTCPGSGFCLGLVSVDFFSTYSNPNCTGNVTASWVHYYRCQ